MVAKQNILSQPFLVHSKKKKKGGYGLAREYCIIEIIIGLDFFLSKQNRMIKMSFGTLQ